MSVIITGLVIHNQGKTSIALTEADGPQTFSEELEAQLVSTGVAKYVNDNPQRKEANEKHPVNGVATGKNEGNDKETGVGIKNDENGLKRTDTPEYSTDMKVAELREIMEECQLQYKVGMSKADMVAALDDYFSEYTEDEDAPPVLGAEEPIL